MDEPLIPAGMPDRETFERVWRRVMPDQSSSPISLSPPAPPQAPAPSDSSAPSAPSVLSAPSTPGGEADLLALLMEQALQECAALQQLARQSPCGGRRLSALASDCRSSYRHLAAARFLLTGKSFQPLPLHTSPPSSVPLSIRERYLAARQTQALCARGAAQTQDSILRDLLNQQALEAEGRADQLLTLLEQLISIP